MQDKRIIIFHGSYFMDFYLKQSPKVQEKIEFAFKVIKTVDRVPEKFLKHISGTEGLYEIRVEYHGNIFRVFCCFDEGNLVVLFNGFQKKTQKTPAQELTTAKKIMSEYFSLKTKGNEKSKIKKR
jgi:phage-related protein